MHVINVMFSKQLGGIEQCFVDYCIGLKNNGAKSTAIIYKEAAVKPALISTKVDTLEVKNLGIWDPLAKSYIKKFIAQKKPDIIIVHGNRAAELIKKQSSNLPIVGVTHNYKTKRLIGLDAIIAITQELKNHVIQQGQSFSSVYEIPNMVKTPTKLPQIKHEFPTPPVIGAMGRFVPCKSFDILIEALSLLNKRNIDFRAIIGGDGEMKEKLESMIQEANLQDKISLPGWIQDKEKFFDEIDIFCLPSTDEAFGIVLLEAFAHGKPTITTNSPGPRQIANNEENSIVVNTSNAKEMSQAIEKLLSQPPLAHSLAQQALETAKKYDFNQLSKRLYSTLANILEAYKEKLITKN